MFCEKSRNGIWFIVQFHRRVTGEFMNLSLFLRSYSHFLAIDILFSLHHQRIFHVCPSKPSKIRSYLLTIIFHFGFILPAFKPLFIRGFTSSILFTELFRNLFCQKFITGFVEISTSHFFHGNRPFLKSCFCTIAAKCQIVRFAFLMRL